MAINLWTANGNDREYAQLTSTAYHTTIRSIPVERNKDYVIKFKAYSLSGISQIRTSLFANTIKYVTATKDLTEFIVEFNSGTSIDAVFIYGYNGANDIYIRDIEIVEKSLGKATINGIDGFYSGKWVLHANAKVIDNDTLELNATAGIQASNIDIPASPNTDYCIGGINNVNSTVRIRNNGPNGTIIKDMLSTDSFVTFKTPADCNVINVMFYNNTGTTGKFALKKPLLNLGTIPAPYEPKRGERMVIPVVVKNLIPDQLFNTPLWTMDVNSSKTLQPDGSWLLTNTAILNGMWTTQNRLGLVLGTLRTLSVWVRADTPQRVGLELGITTYFDVGTEWKLISVNSILTSPGVAIKAGDAAAPGRIYFKDMQLEDGLLTPYEQYRVQKTQKSIKKTKNLVTPYKGSSTYDFAKKISGWILSSGIDITEYNEYGFTFSTPSAYRSVGYCYFTNPEEIGKQAIFSSVVTGSGAMTLVVRFFNAADAQISQTVAGGVGLKRVIATIPPGTTRIHVFGEISTVNDTHGIDQIQLEITEVGAPATPFEPYKLLTKRINKIPRKNLIKGEKEQNNDLFNVGSSGLNNVWENGKLKVINGHASVHGKGVWVDVEIGKPHTLSFKGTDAIDGAKPRVRIGYNSTNGVEIANALQAYPFTFTPMQSPISMRFGRDGTTDAGDKPVYVWDIQLELGSAQSAYEPFRSGLAPARKGLEFNGSSDRMQAVFPAGALDTIGANKDFTIESTFTINGPNALNSAQQTVFSCGDIRFGMSNQNVNNIGFYTPTTGWVDAIPGTLSGRRITLKAVVKPTKVELYFNGVFIKDYVYSGAINTVQTVAHIATLGGGSYFLNGSIETIKIVSQGGTIIDFDFTKPRNKIGTVFKANAGANGTIIGSPVQLNRQSTR